MSYLTNRTNALTQTVDPVFDEGGFREWYVDWAIRAGIDPDPDKPEHRYDYRAAYRAGAEPEISDEDGRYHWPSTFKAPDHPNRYVNGMDTITGQPVNALRGTPSQPSVDLDVLIGEAEAATGQTTGQMQPQQDLDTLLDDAYKSTVGEATPDLTLDRAAGAFVAGAQDIVRTPYKAMEGISQATLGKDSAVTGFFRQGANAPVLKTDPEFAGKSSGWVEDFIRSAPQMGSQIVLSMAAGPLVGMGYMGLQIAGGDYENLVQQGVSPDRAIVAGVADAIMQAPMEQLGISKITGLFKVRKTLLKKMKDVGEALGTEWFTEFAQAFPQSITEIWAKNPDKAVLDKASEFLDKAMETAKQGAYEGTLTAPWALLGLATAGKPRQAQPGVKEKKGEEKPPTETTAPTETTTTQPGAIPTEDDINRMFGEAEAAAGIVSEKPVEEAKVEDQPLTVPKEGAKAEEPGEVVYPSTKGTAEEPTKDNLEGAAEDRIKLLRSELESLKDQKGKKARNRRKAIRAGIRNLKGIVATEQEKAKAEGAATAEGYFTPEKKAKGQPAYPDMENQPALQELRNVLTGKTGRIREEIDRVANEAATSPENELPEPTEGQKSAENYRMAHPKPELLHGLDVSIENPKGSTRKGTNEKTGEKWEVVMQAHYGHINDTEGADSTEEKRQGVDVFIGEHPESETAFVIDQVDPETGDFDEHKTLVNYTDEEDARKGYLANYAKDWKGLGAITAMPMDQFKTWLREGDKTRPVGKIAKGGEVAATGQVVSIQKHRDMNNVSQKLDELKAQAVAPDIESLDKGKRSITKEMMRTKFPKVDSGVIGEFDLIGYGNKARSDLDFARQEIERLNNEITTIENNPESYPGQRKAFIETKRELIASLQKLHPDLAATGQEGEGKAVAIRTGKPWQKPNVVFMEVRGYNDNKLLGYVTEPYDGTKEGAQTAAQKLSKKADALGEWSNIQSRRGATDENANPKFTVSPNLKHVAHVTEDEAEARYIWGDVEAIKQPKTVEKASAPPLPTPKEAVEEGKKGREPKLTQHELRILRDRVARARQVGAGVSGIEQAIREYEEDPFNYELPYRETLSALNIAIANKEKADKAAADKMAERPETVQALARRLRPNGAGRFNDIGYSIQQRPDADGFYFRRIEKGQVREIGIDASPPWDMDKAIEMALDDAERIEESPPAPAEKKASEATADDLLAEWDRQAEEMEGKKEEPAEPPKKAKEKPAGEPLPSWAAKKVGENSQGIPVYETADGNRIIPSGNFRHEAPRPLISNGQILKPYSPKELFGANRSEFLTKEEFEQFKGEKKTEESKPKEGEPSAKYKEGDRVVITDKAYHRELEGRHGVVSKVDVSHYTMTPVFGPGKSDRRTDIRYEVKTDAGAMLSMAGEDAISTETDKAPEVVPDIEFGTGEFRHPSVVKVDAQNKRKHAVNMRSKASRAKIESKKGRYRLEASDADKAAAALEAKYSEWAAKYKPEELVAEKPAGPTAQPAAPAGKPTVDLVYHETKHTQKGHDLFVVSIGDRVPREKFVELRRKAQTFGGYWSRFAQGGAIPGFQFTEKQQAQDFMAVYGYGKPGEGEKSTTEWMQKKSLELRTQPEESLPSIQEIVSPGIRWDRFLDSLTPEQKTAASGLIGREQPRNVNAQIRAIEAVIWQATPAEKAKESVDHVKNAIDKFKKINIILGEKGLIGKDIDERKWDQIKPLLREAWDEIVAAGKSAKEFVQLAIQTLSPKGRPYFEKFVREEVGHESADTGRGKQGEGAPTNDQGRAPGEESPDVPTTGGGEQAGGVRGRSGEGDDAGVPGGVEPGPLGSPAGKEREGEPARTDQRVRGESPAPVGVDTGNVPGVLTPGSDYIIPNGGLERKGGWKTAAKSNLDAIELSKKILSENRPATKAEQEILVKYVGWGASELANKMFPGYNSQRKIMPTWADTEWQPLVDRLVSLLTEDEIVTAARSTQYAHYTSEGVIRSIYRAMLRFGFEGGKILEAGLGIGHFIGLLPESIRPASLYTGIEMDSISAGIAKLLYPNHNILAQDFTKTLLPRDFFDAAIGNPPFGAISILADSEYRKFRFKLHNYFFAKSLDRVRPGGVLAFVTSRYTMDSQGKKVREYLAKSADLIGAVRLPQTAFKKNAGTEVVTDVLYLRKRVKGETAESSTVGQDWMDLAEVDTPEGKTLVNQYFASHPEMVLGRHSMKGTMHGKNEYTVLPIEGDIEELFDKSIENLPEGVYSKTTETTESLQKKTFERDYNPKNRKEGGVYLSEKGALKIVDFGSGVDIEAVYPQLSSNEKTWLKDYTFLRDAVKQSHYDQLTDGGWEASLNKLHAAYRRFVKKHGRLSEYTVSSRKSTDEDGNIQEVEYRRYKNEKLLRVDAEGSIVAALEKITEDGAIVEQPALSQRTIKKPEEPKIESVSDALAVSLNDRGHLDIPHVAQLIGMKEGEVIDSLGDLIFKNPSGGHLLADEYLSGNVVRKLEEAEAAARVDPVYDRNVEALRKAQPDPLAAKDITIIPGAPWIPIHYMETFGEEVLGLPGCEVKHYESSNAWTVRGNFQAQGKRAAGEEYGTADRGANEIFESALNARVIKITHKDDDGKTWTDTAATTAANEKLNALKSKFATWVWQYGNRAKDLLKIYNRQYNNLAPRKFDGSHLTLPGASALVKLYDHQKRAIWRIIQTGNAYLAHAVGAGKTFVMIAAGMEMKRLGMISKPLYVVPNHMLGQFAREFNELYPTAHVMVADERNFHTENRRRFVAQATLNNPDAIIVPHSSFGLFALKPETVKPVKDEFLGQLRDAWEEMKDEGEPYFLIKQMEKRIEQAEQRFDSMISSGDKAVSFEEMGVDYLFLDEAHEFRKLDYVTNQKIKGIDPNGSKKAMDLYIKTLWLEKQRPGRSHAFASGTPITNTLGELFTVMRFFDPKGMEEDGTDHFDAWSSMFARAAVGYEMNSAGRYQPVERFSKFINIPELMSRVRQFMDVLTSSQLASRVKLPNVRGGKPEIVVSEPIPELKDYQDNVLAPRIKTSMEWKPSKEERGNPDPMINIITDGRLASIDMRFVRPRIPPNPKSKLNKWIDGIIETYNQSKTNEYLDTDGTKSPSKGASIVCFYNHGFGEAVKVNRGLDARSWVMGRLRAAEIPAKDVAWIDDYPKDKKEGLFRELRTGKKRILFGSAKKMGTGMNVQNRLQFLHYLDPPWYPADVEQPMGRIVRQGNQNEEVDARWYATKGSYDATMWQLVATKSKFIEKAFLGEKDLRSMEDLSESSQYEMASALASGDERVIRVVALRAQVEKFHNLQVEYENNKWRFKHKIGNLESDIKYKGERLDILRRMAKHVTEYQHFETGEIDGKTYDKREEFNIALATKIHHREGLDKSAEVLVGKINGYKIYHTVTNRWLESESGEKLTRKEIEKFKEEGKGLRNGFSAEINLRFEKGLDEAFYAPDVTAQKLINFLNRIDSDIEQRERDIRNHREEIKELESRLAAPFEFEREYAEAVAELSRIEQELASEGEKVQGQAFVQMTQEEADENRKKLIDTFVADLAKVVIEEDNEKNQDIATPLSVVTTETYADRAYLRAIDVLIDQRVEITEELEGKLDNLRAIYLQKESYLDYPAVIWGYPEYGVSVLTESPDISLSLSEGTPPGLSPKLVESIVRRVQSGMPGAPIFHVVKEYKEFPDSVKNGNIVSRLSEDKKGKIKGVHQVGKDGKTHIYLVASNFNTTVDVIKTMIHESVGHEGVRLALGPDLEPFLDSLYAAKANDELMEWIVSPKNYGFDIKTAMGRQKAADEWFARTVVEKGYKEPTLRRWWNQFVRIFRNWARKAGFRVTLSDAEIADVVNRAWGQMERGPSKAGGREGQAANIGEGQDLLSTIRSLQTPGQPRELVSIAKLREKTGEGKASISLEGKKAVQDIYDSAVQNIDDSKLELTKKAIREQVEYVEGFRYLSKEERGLLEDLINRNGIMPAPLDSQLLDLAKSGKVALHRGDPVKGGKGLWVDGEYYVGVVPRGEEQALDVGEVRPGDVNTEEFKRWFGASKVVDSKGKPLVVYHGTAGNFQVFDPAASRVTTARVNAEPDGFFFTPRAGSAEAYSVIAEERGGSRSIVPAYLKIENPLVVNLGVNPSDFYGHSREQIQRKGYDGIILKDRGGKIIEYAAFSPTQIKSVFNSGTWSEEEGDINLDIGDSGTIEDWNNRVTDEWKNRHPESADKLEAEEKAYGRDFARGSLAPMRGLLKLWKARGANWREGKPDTTVLDRIVSVPSHHFEKVEGLKKMYEAALERPDQYYELVNTLTKGPDGRYYTETMDSLRKTRPEEYGAFKDYLITRDRNQVGYRVVKEEKGEGYILFDPKKQRVGAFETESKAWARAITEEARAYRAGGASDLAVESLVAARMITHKGFTVLIRNLQDIIAKYEAQGWDLPKVAVKSDGKGVEVDLKVAVAMMGDMRGSYFPRIRRPGRYMMVAKKEGVNPIMEFFDTKTMIARRQLELEKDGYAVEKDLSPALGEDVFDMAKSIIGIQAQINEALKRVHSTGLTLEDFGMRSTERMIKPGKREILITGPTSKEHNEVLKAMGGRFFEADLGGVRVWHFTNPGANFEKRLTKALANSVPILDQETQLLFAKALAEQVANVIKARGHRSHMIERKLATGTDVWVGYEEDPVIALAKYARGLAAGEAKKNMALRMVRAFTGTDISWQEFKGLEGNEEVEYEDYLAEVDRRRIDPAKQPNAFREGKVFMEDTLRNEEWMDRAIGTVKGVAVLKYLGFRVAAPLVNLTALVTSVPAAMQGFGGIPINRSFRLLGQAMTLYRQYLSGDKAALAPDVLRMFDEMDRKGWAKPQLNQEALAVLEGKLGRGWNRLIETSMWMFGKTEQLNRASTIAASYMGIRQMQPDLPHEDAMELAKKVSDRAHGVYGKANIPHFARGGDLGAQLIKMFYVFRTFSHNYLLTMKELGVDQKNAKAFSYMLLSPAILAGAGATVATPILQALARALGIGGDDPEEEFYDWLDKNLGEYGERFGRSGLFGLAGISLKGSLQIGITDIPTTISDILGAPGSVVKDLYDGGRNLTRGDALKGAEKILPNFAASVSRAYRETTEGVTTQNNTPVFWGKDPLVADTVESIFRAMSFNPARIGEIREQLYREHKSEAHYTEMRTEIYSRFKKFYHQPEAERSEADYVKLMAMVQNYNRELEERGLIGKVPSVTWRSIRTNLIRAFRPSKRERIRAAEEEED